jgi:FeS assembly SUF system regulator
MLKLTKKADYGLIALKHLAEAAARDSSNGTVSACSAKEIADEYAVPQEALAKILQRLVKSGLLVSQHGINGGYALARDARHITAFEAIKAIDGPLFITSCSTHKGECVQSVKCNVKEPLKKVNDSIHAVLNKITIADMQDTSTGRDTSEPNESPQRASQSNLVTLS